MSESSLSDPLPASFGRCARRRIKGSRLSRRQYLRGVRLNAFFISQQVDQHAALPVVVFFFFLIIKRPRKLPRYSESTHPNAHRGGALLGKRARKKINAPVLEASCPRRSSKPATSKAPFPFFFTASPRRMSKRVKAFHELI